MANSRVLITGVAGFVGRALAAQMQSHGYAVRGAVRTPMPPDTPFEAIQVGAIDSHTDWSEALRGVDIVIHLAARTHMIGEHDGGSLADYRPVNVEGTQQLAEAAISAGVRRLVFLSSVKVNGERTFERPFTADDAPSPENAYGITKLEAENVLQDLSSMAPLEVVIIRPPLVYGPSVRGNFLSMMRWVHRGIPLPLGAIHNKRSLVGLDNLVDLIATCADHPAAANQVFLAGDGEDLSTTELLQRVGVALGRPARLIPVPAPMLKVGAALVGKQMIAQRLLGSLQVDISKTRQLLGWTPSMSVEEGLGRTAGAFLSTLRQAS